MSQITLFEEWERQSEEYQRVGESDFCFLDRSNRPKIAEIRSTLNYWFSLLPEEAKKDFKRRFMTDHNFAGVFYELFLFILFKKMCFDIEFEPKLEGKSKKPDFLLTKKGSQIVVEATTNEHSTTSRITNIKIRQQVVCELNKLDLGDLRLLIYDLKLFVDQTPSINYLKKLLLEHCKKIDLTEYSNHSIIDSDTERFTYQDEHLSFTTAFFVDMKKENQVKRTVCCDSYDFRIDETIKEINKSIKNKKNRYGKFRKPYIICVNFPRENLDQEEVLSLLRPLDLHKHGIYCKSRGLSALENIIDPSISAIFISFVIPYNIADPQFWFIKNPQACFPIEPQLFMLDSYEYDNDNFVFKVVPTTISEVLHNPWVT